MLVNYRIFAPKFIQTINKTLIKKAFTTIMIDCATLAGTLRAQNPIDIETILPQINADSLLRTVMEMPLA